MNKLYKDMSDAEKQEEDKRAEIIENLSAGEEELLKEAHADIYTGTDDDMPDAFESWLQSLTREEIYKIIF